MHIKYGLGFLLMHASIFIQGQSTDSLKNELFSIHAQTTVVNQYKPGFNAAYSGENSLITKEENKISLTSTLYLGSRLWKGAEIYINPEIAGGAGLSNVLGIAAAPNGETFRIGDPTPKIYLARIFFRQIFALSKESNQQESDFNQIKTRIPVKYFGFTIGKIGVADMFDDNEYSHDPRTQFMSWALMDNGGWDYPADTRGYSPSIVLEYVSAIIEMRYGFSLVPVTANGSKMNWNIPQAGSHTFEITRRHKIRSMDGALRFLAFLTSADMGNYRESVMKNPQNPDIESTRKPGNTKFGFALNAEQQISADAGCFFRMSWNDGNNETWMFTEIDHSFSTGLVTDGKGWKRENDHIGLAYVISGISKPHREYLQAGGKGFMLGDGNLNYSYEHLTELYYSFALYKTNIFVTGAWQFLVNPAYNRDRHGPVNIFSVRFHAKI